MIEMTQLKEKLSKTILRKKVIKDPRSLLVMTSNITFYGSVHEIGGNKFLIEDKGTKIFLDLECKWEKQIYIFPNF